MNDRELLEMAAKAAGIAWTEYNDEYGLVLSRSNMGDELLIWNPLLFDGDALRLANFLDLTIGRTYDGAYVDLCSGEILQHMEDGCQHEVKWAECGGDKNMACRRAIVRAAAEIGRSMS